MQIFIHIVRVRFLSLTHTHTLPSFLVVRLFLCAIIYKDLCSYLNGTQVDMKKGVEALSFVLVVFFFVVEKIPSKTHFGISKKKLASRVEWNSFSFRRKNTKFQMKLCEHFN